MSVRYCEVSSSITGRGDSIMGSCSAPEGISSSGGSTLCNRLVMPSEVSGGSEDGPRHHFVPVLPLRTWCSRAL